MCTTVILQHSNHFYIMSLAAYGSTLHLESLSLVYNLYFVDTV